MLEAQSPGTSDVIAQYEVSACPMDFTSTLSKNRISILLERGAGGGESKHSRKMFRQNHTGCMRKELYMISIGSNMGTGSQN